MFVISQSESYAWPVEVKLPASGGTFDKHTFEAEFKRMPASRIRELIAREDILDIDFCREVMVGWKGIVDNNMKEIPFSETARDRMLDVPGVAQAIYAAFLESHSGARRKN